MEISNKSRGQNKSLENHTELQSSLYVQNSLVVFTYTLIQSFSDKQNEKQEVNGYFV